MCLIDAVEDVLALVQEVSARTIMVEVVALQSSLVHQD